MAQGTQSKFARISSDRYSIIEESVAHLPSADVAQMAEQCTCNAQIGGSNPLVCSTNADVRSTAACEVSNLDVGVRISVSAPCECNAGVDFRDNPSYTLRSERILMENINDYHEAFMAPRRGVLYMMEEWFEFIEMKATQQDPQHHPEGNVFTHTEMALDVLDEIDDGMDCREALIASWAVLFHDIGKIETTELQADGRITARGHEDASVAIMDEVVLEHFGFAALQDPIIQQARFLVGMHMQPFNFGKAKPRAYRRLLRKFDTARVNPTLLTFVSIADRWGRAVSDARKDEDMTALTDFAANCISSGYVFKNL